MMKITSIPLKGLVPHQAAKLVPDMRDHEYADLLEDVRSHGIKEPIKVLGSTILDGRHRVRAAREAGLDLIPAHEVDLDGETETEYLLKAAALRRHLSDHQRAMIAAMYAKANPKPKGGDKRSEEAQIKSPPVGGVDPKAKHIPPAQREAASLMNVSAKSVERAAAVMKADPKLAESVRQGDVPLGKAFREINRTTKREALAESAKPLGTVNAKAAVIYADPPWLYEHCETDNRQIENQYPTMPLADICALPVGDATTKDALLFLWATSPKLDDAMKVIRAWGFIYRSSIVWVKDKIGMGYWARARHEFLLIATKGNFPTPDPKDRPDSVQEFPRGKHSAKPTEFYKLIESMTPGLPRLEMFQRSTRDGWIGWGNECKTP